MKREVDLTENNEFSSNRSYHYASKKRVPWREETIDYYDGRYIVTYTDVLTDEVLFEDDDSIIMDDLYSTGWETFSGNISILSNNTVTSSFRVSDIVHEVINLSSGKTTTVYSPHRRIKYKSLTREFVGRAKDLRKNHELVELCDINKINHRKKTCEICHKKVLASPWNKSYYICEKCKDRGFKENHSRIRKPYDFRCIPEPIPCISSDIENVRHKEPIYKRPPWRFNLLNPSSWVALKRVKHARPIGTVYYKNRELGFREEPWQPNGRIRQEYDDFYDQIEWRDLIANRFKDYL